MNEEDRQATELSRRRFLTHTVAGLAAASAVGFGAGMGKATETAGKAVRGDSRASATVEEAGFKRNPFPPGSFCVH